MTYGWRRRALPAPALWGVALGLMVASCTSSGGDGQLGKLASVTEVVEAQVISVGSSSSAVLDDYGVVRIEITDVLLVLDEAQAPALQVAAVTDARSFDPGSFATGRTFVMFLANDPRFGDDAWSIEFVFDQATNRPAAQSDDATTSDVIRQVLLEGEDESDLLGALMALVGEYQVTQGEMTPRRNHLYPP